MSTSGVKILKVFFTLGIVGTACSSGPPQSCGESIGATADTEIFDQHFTSMELVSQTTGQTGQDGEKGFEFSQ